MLVGNPVGVGLTQSVISSLSLSLSPVKELVNNVCMVVSPCGADRATSMASSWMENPTDKDRLLPKHQRCPPFPV